METAMGIAAVVIALGLCLAALAAVSNTLRCQDAAYAAARLAARGDNAAAQQIAAQLAPAGAQVGIDRDGALVRVRVTAPGVSILPGIRVTGHSAAALELPPDSAVSGPPP